MHTAARRVMVVEVRPSVGRTPNAGAVGPKAGSSQQLSGHTAQATEGMKQQIRIKAYLLVLGLTHRVSLIGFLF